ncbi:MULTISPECIES: putative RNA methyltransferase [Halomonadaceae]|uniref:putative RNA methyltransferase n=1 Tax=Halomonadaceae TaxID=28256 RepID=UPI00111B11D8|nr:MULTISPECIES: methyltransferase domain-containing protein [Halomonas]MCG7589272.1 methyltransferase domain-containing protein [Halomonas sp. McD50-5]MCG7615433.1 methyltransferase domain-containing protein [Halomonas sp. McD50-4]TNH19778.1 methyltransferase domain-containing protein [Halomonas sp. BL6]BCB61270.1 23S rRNA (guanine(745)-N(1))-methyltransferase [Halomonas sp. A020]
MTHRSPFQALACPLDGEPLHLEGGTWRCASNHSFDVAKQGYVNLLPVQQKRSTDPGDSKAMVAARQRFLAAGEYAPIAEALSQAVVSHADQTQAETYCCLDAGCGEGYYLRQLAHNVPESQALSLLGLDISKWAVQSAAKQDDKQAPICRWVVGSNAQLPIQSASVDSVLCMFGFPVYSEFARVLKTGGQLIQVDAGPQHLRELRDIIYPTLKPTREKETNVPEGFARRASEQICYAISLEGGDVIRDLLTMTPHLYRASAEGREKAAALDQLTLTIDAQLTVWERD